MKKMYLYLKWFILLLCSYFIIKFLFFIYEITAPYPIVEIERISNINNSFDAVLAIREVGATDSTPTLVYIVQKNELLSVDLKPILTATNVNNIKLTWENNNQLIIKADQALIHSFEGYEYFKTKDNINQFFYIKLDVNTYYK